MKVLVSKEDAWRLQNSMFFIEGSWETGFTYNKEIFFMEGVTTFCEEGESSPYRRPVEIVERYDENTGFYLELV